MDPKRKRIALLAAGLGVICWITCTTVNYMPQDRIPPADISSSRLTAEHLHAETACPFNNGAAYDVLDRGSRARGSGE